jgi:hypothetical protein
VKLTLGKALSIPVLAGSSLLTVSDLGYKESFNVSIDTVGVHDQRWQEVLMQRA